MQLEFNELWPYILSVLTLAVLPFLVSGDKPTGVVQIVNALKKWLKAEDASARAITFIVSLVLAVLIALVDGSIKLTGAMTPERFAIILSILVASSQYWYNRLQKETD